MNSQVLDLPDWFSTSGQIRTKNHEKMFKIFWLKKLGMKVANQIEENEWYIDLNCITREIRCYIKIIKYDKKTWKVHH